MNGHGTAPYGLKTSYTVEDPDYDLRERVPGSVQGWNFNGWSPSIIPHGSYGDKTVKANWSAGDCQISFIYHDGTSLVRTETKKYDSPLGELDSPTR